MEAFVTDEFKALPARKRAILLYDALVSTLVGSGIRKDRNAVGSGLQEIVAILRCEDLTPRHAGTQGYDALTRDGRPVDVKVCESALDKLVNLNIKLPVSVQNEYSLKRDAAALFWHIYETQMVKCAVMRFIFKDYLDLQWDGVFVAAAICKYYEKNKSLAINWSGRYCRQCNHIHRMKHMLSYEKPVLAEVARAGELNAKKWHQLLANEELWRGFFSPQRQKCV